MIKFGPYRYPSHPIQNYKTPDRIVAKAEIEGG
jgi:hypothetical protein